MTSPIAAMKMALEALEPLMDADIESRPGYAIEDYHARITEAIEALRAALAEAEPHVCDKPSECRWHPWCAENNKCLSKFQDAMPAGAFGTTKQEPT